MDNNQMRRRIAKLQGVNLLECPDWPGDISLALALMIDGCSLNRVDYEWPAIWECTSPHPTDDPRCESIVSCYADTPEMAICAWYIAWAELKAGEDD